MTRPPTSPRWRRNSPSTARDVRPEGWPAEAHRAPRSPADFTICAIWPIDPGWWYSTRSTCPRPVSWPNSSAGDLEAAGHRVFPISTATHEGLDALKYALAEVVAAGSRGPPGAGRGAHHRPPGRDRRRRFLCLPGSGGGGRLPRQRSPARTLDPADRLQQRRSGRVPRRPVGPTGRRGATGQAGGRTGRPRPDRRHQLRLGAGRLRATIPRPVAALDLRLEQNDRVGRRGAQGNAPGPARPARRRGPRTRAATAADWNIGAFEPETDDPLGLTR